MAFSDWDQVDNQTTGLTAPLTPISGELALHAASPLTTNPLANTGGGATNGTQARVWNTKYNAGNSQAQQFKHYGLYHFANAALDGGAYRATPNTQAILVEGYIRVEQSFAERDPPPFATQTAPVSGALCIKHHESVSSIRPWLGGYKLLLGESGGERGIVKTFNLRICAGLEWVNTGSPAGQPGVGNFVDVECDAPPYAASYATAEWHRVRFTCTWTGTADLLEAFVDSTRGVSDVGVWVKVGELAVASAETYFQPWSDASLGNGFLAYRYATGDGDSNDSTEDEKVFIDCVRLAVRTI